MRWLDVAQVQVSRTHKGIVRRRMGARTWHLLAILEKRYGSLFLPRGRGLCSPLLPPAQSLGPAEFAR